MSYELVLHGQSYAAREWRNAKPWNPPSSASIEPRRSASYGLRLLLAPSLDMVERTLLRAGMPVAQPLPSPVLPSDMASSSILLALPAAVSSSPPSADTIGVEPRGAVLIHGCEPAGTLPDAASLPHNSGLDAASAPLSRAAGAGEKAARYRCTLRPVSPPADGRVRLIFELLAHAMHVHVHALSRRLAHAVECPYRHCNRSRKLT